MVRSRFVTAIAGIVATFGISAAASAASGDLTETYGEWTATYRPSTGLAMSFIQNSSKSLFGTVCSRGKCDAFLDPKISCDDGAEYPALINAPSAAFHVRVRCSEMKDGGTYYILSLDGGVADAMSVGGILGIAFPMQSGQFRVERFSLTGAARAAARASQLANVNANPGRRQVRDDGDSQTL